MISNFNRKQFFFFNHYFLFLNHEVTSKKKKTNKKILHLKLTEILYYTLLPEFTVDPNKLLPGAIAFTWIPLK